MEAWVRSDRKIIGQIYATHQLREFLPDKPCAGELTAEQRFTGLLQRACILARKGLWNESAQDLRQAGEIAQSIGKSSLSGKETDILRRIFDLFSYAPHTFGEASGFRKALHEMRPRQLRNDMRAAILWPLPFTIGAALLHGHYNNFWRFLSVYLALATPSAAARNVFSWSFFRTGLELVRLRRGGSKTRRGNPSDALADSAG